MVGISAAVSRLRRTEIAELVPIIATAAAFLVVFWAPLTTLLRDWWNDPEWGHGLLLGPLALFFAWRRGLVAGRRPQQLLGLTLLIGALLLRYVAGLAAELFTLRLSMLGGAAGLIVYFWGGRQLLHWWLPVSLLVLSVPIPEILLSTAAFPLQLQASRLGTVLLEARHVPVRLAGNIIQLPGRSLFVTEACSGLRSLTALLALGVLIGGLWLRSPWTRLALVISAVPVAMALNGLRVFVTGYLAYFVDTALGDGFMHYTEGWVIFLVAFAILGGVARILGAAEKRMGVTR